MLIYPLKKNISLELDVLYSCKGVGFRLVNALPDVYASKTSYNLEVPLFLNFVLDKKEKFFLQVGPHLQANHLRLFRMMIKRQ